MAKNKEDIILMDPDEVLNWDAKKVDAGLKAMEIPTEPSWSKSRKSHVLHQAIKTENTENPKNTSQIQGQDPNMMMFQMFQAMQQQMKEDRDESKAQAQAMAAQIMEMHNTNAAIMEKISGASTGSGGGGGSSKSRAKGLHPEKLERDLDYATFLQWEKSWNLYVVSDQLETLTDQQQTAIFFSFFTKELLSDLEYRFKIDINDDQKTEDFIDAMKTYLKGQRSIILARYNLFTRRQHHGETFEEWYCELRRLYDLAEAEEMTGEDLLTVLITTGVRDEKVRSKILEDLRTPTQDETVKLIGQMVYAKDTNARIERRREEANINAVKTPSSNRRPIKTSYQKDKEFWRMERANTESETNNVERTKGKCNYCGRDRHPDNGQGWRKMCPAQKAECMNCKQMGHFRNTVACKFKKLAA